MRWRLPTWKFPIIPYHSRTGSCSLPCLASASVPLAWPYVALPHQFTCTFFPNLTNLHHLLLTFSPAHTHHTHTQRLIPPNHALLFCAPFQSEEFSPLLTRLDPSLTSSFLYFIFRALFHRPNPCRLLIPSRARIFFARPRLDPFSARHSHSVDAPILVQFLDFPSQRLALVRFLDFLHRLARRLAGLFCSPAISRSFEIRSHVTPVISQNLRNRRSSCASGAPAS